MSRLEYYQRPLVAFDAEDADHRAYFHEYLIRKTWGRCPVRFICPDEHGPEGLVGIVQRQLVDYYLKQEFGLTPKTKGIPIPTHKIKKPRSLEIDQKLSEFKAKQASKEKKNEYIDQTA